jgi:predicted ester cyclase
MASLQEVNKSLVVRYIQEVWHRNRVATLEDFLAPNYQRYLSPLAGPLSLDGQKQRIAGFRLAFPDVQITIEDIFAEGDRVGFRSIMRGTHQGVFQGIQPTGKKITVFLLDVIRVENGRFVEHWGGPDLFDLLKQLGAVFSAG